MISFLFHTFFYNPIYNGLIFLTTLSPLLDLGVAVVLITIIVKLLIFPITKKSIQTQIKIKEIDPLVKEIKEKYKEDKEKMTKEMMKLYSEKNVNPFSSFFLVLVQMPILFALYFVFLRGGLPDVNFDILYPFIHSSPHISNIKFLGLIDITQKNLFLALLAGLTQFFQMKIVMPKIEKKKEKESLKEEMIRNVQLQTKYIMPVFIFFIAYGLLSAVALYWTTSNLFMIGQELYVRKNIKNKKK